MHRKPRHIYQGNYILTGPVDSGKSTALWQFFLSSLDAKVSGWISLPFFEDGEKKGYDIVFIENSRPADRKLFIRKEGQGFRFNEEIFCEAIKYVEVGDKKGVFIIDEVGPIELVQKGGFWPFLNVIYSSYLATLTVVRDSCVADFKKAFSRHKFEFFSQPLTENRKNTT